MFPRRPDGGRFSPFDRFRFRARKPERPSIKLSEEQNLIAKYIVSSDESVFFTGNAGTGKSVLLREVIYRLNNMYQNHEVAITASTGISALELRGVTLHTFAGVRLAREPVDTLISMIRSNKRLLERWRSTRVLVIDEVSMIDCDLFDKLESIARMTRNNDSPFGGIKLILCGDFMQLPPVSKRSKFIFESKNWDLVIKRIFVLKEVFRQKDKAFIEMLSEIRNGMVSRKCEELLRSLERPPKSPSPEYSTVRLFPLRSQVEAYNEMVLDGLRGPIHVFRATNTGSVEYMHALNRLNAAEILRLKAGASVMLIKNLTESLVNGSIGKITSFEPSTGLPNVTFTVDSCPCTITVQPESWNVETYDGAILATRTQIPLALAYCMSIHKSQGLTFHSVSIDMRKIFESGQAYVALSRASSLEGLQVLNYDPKRIIINPKVREFNRSIELVSSDIFKLTGRYQSHEDI